MPKAKVRGIYSTALTKLLLENGFEIVEPSIAIRERFGLEDNAGAYDLEIEDREDRQGIRATGKHEAIEMLRSILHLNLEDVITRKCPVSANGIYKGLIRGVERNMILVDIGHAVGKLPKNQIEELDKQKGVLVQVQRKAFRAKNPILTTKIKVLGRYAILIPANKIGVSLRIRDVKKRFQLMKLGRELAPEGWGIIWRSAAAEQEFEVLRNEVADLVRLGEEIAKKAELAEAPSLIWEGLYHMDVEFPALSKRKMDELRATVTPTLEGHHYYKAYGGRISSALEMAEKLLERGSSRKEVENLFRQTIEKEYPLEGTTIEIHHVKLNGRIFNLGEAFLESFDGHKLCFRRVFGRPGTYDGLGVKREAGDQAVTEAQIGGWHFKTSYFSKDGRYKGTYINFNTPIELYPHGIRYVDLEVDVCVWPDGTAKAVDEDKLEEAVKNGIISERLASLVKREVDEALRNPQNR